MLLFLRRLALLLIFFPLIAAAQNPSIHWGKAFSGLNDDIAWSLAATADNMILVAGHFEGPSITIGQYSLVNTNNLTTDFFLVKMDSSGNVLWATSAGGNGIDGGSKVCVDQFGNYYVSGFLASSSISIGSNVLTNSNPPFRDFFLVKYNSNGGVIWVKSFGGVENDNALGLTCDNGGNIILSGNFDSPVLTFGNFTLQNAGGGGSDLFVAKFDSAGNVLWAESTGGSGLEAFEEVGTDDLGNIYCAGNFTSSVLSFGQTNLMNQGGQDILIVKYDSAGGLLWAKSIGGLGKEQVDGLSISAGGAINLVGNFLSSSISFGGYLVSNQGANDILFCKLDSSGMPLLFKAWGGPSAEAGYDVKYGNDGSTFLAGFFRSQSLSFSPYILNCSDSGEIFVVKLDSAGVVSWAKAIGGSGFDNATAICQSPQGSLLLSGYFLSPSVSLGVGNLTNINNGGTTADAYVIKLGENPLSFPGLDMENNAISLLPNPAESQCTLRSNRGFGKVRIQVFDVAGLVVRDFEMDAGPQLQIDRNGLPAGRYYIRVILRASGETALLSMVFR